jgi:hypothetical protein
MIRHRVSVALWLVFVMLSMASPADAALQRADRYTGRPLADVLRELQKRGAPIIFSASLVGTDLRVKAEPRRTHGLRELTEDILAPHDLALTNGPKNTWLVVRAPKPSPRTPDRAKPQAPTAPPNSRAETPVRIEEKVEVSDRAGEARGQCRR